MDPRASRAYPYPPAAPNQPHHSSPISLLPTELLIRAVDWALPRGDKFAWCRNDNPKEYFTTLYRCMQVSKHWENVIRNVELFWAIVDSRSPESAWKRLLARSLSQPLAIMYDEYSRLRNSDFIFHTFHRIHRWSSAELWLQQPGDVALFNSSKASTLRRLRIYFRGPGSSLPNVRISQSNTPLLQHLFLSYVTLDSSGLSQLLSLKLVEVQLPSMVQFLSALRNNPGLYSLFLCTCHFDGGTDSDTEGVTPVFLERLVSLGLYDLDPDAARAMTALYTPNCPRYRFHYDDGNEGGAELVQSFISGKEKAVLLQALLSKHRQLEISMNTFSWEIRVRAEGDNDDNQMEDSRAGWVLKAGGLSARQVLIDWLIPIMNSISTYVSATLQAKLTFNDLSEDETLELLGSLHGLEVMELDAQVEPIHLIMDGLSHPTIRDDGARTWLCPRLHTIRLKNIQYSSPEILLGLVENRSKAEEGEPSDDWPTRLVHLEVLGSSPMDDPTWLQITSILGDAALWDPDDNDSS
ncbi:hypothetical protein FRB94_002330 [Tulasnella sp. JGI-2019a]|nr:hypothetical protein FRB94_002330 [Tulasnella sp. JGI-2019a]KAG9012752.1 hypothetical protein FRB93_001305 [Tulasnella sp. JGI-2019a]